MTEITNEPSPEISSPINRLEQEYYTNAQVAKGLGRTLQHWCRIRPKYIAKYNLECVMIAHKYWYKKEPVDKMIDELLKTGETYEKETSIECKH